MRRWATTAPASRISSPSAGQTTDHGSRDADQDPGYPGDLEGSDRPVASDGEPEVGGPDPHGGQCENLQSSERGEHDRNRYGNDER